MSTKSDYHIGKYIKAAREKRGITQMELANALGYKARSAIARIENGHNDVPLSKVESFAKALNVTRGYLMGWEDEVEEILEALDAVKIVGDALEQTGYYEDRFTEDEISEIMEYAHFVLLKRAKK